MLKLIGIIGNLMTIFGISGGMFNRNMLPVAAIGLCLISISYIFLPKNDNF